MISKQLCLSYVLIKVTHNSPKMRISPFLLRETPFSRLFLTVKLTVEMCTLNFLKFGCFKTPIYCIWNNFASHMSLQKWPATGTKWRFSHRDHGGMRHTLVSPNWSENLSGKTSKSAKMFFFSTKGTFEAVPLQQELSETDHGKVVCFGLQHGPKRWKSAILAKYANHFLRPPRRL